MGRIEAMDSMTWNTPVLAGRYLLVRNDKEVVCFRLGEGAR
jgi:outer membrane protein assembly factor BamB